MEGPEEALQGVLDVSLQVSLQGREAVLGRQDRQMVEEGVQRRQRRERVR